MEEFHSHARNAIESLNHQLKTGGENIEESSRRPVRGFAAAQVMKTILINFNLRKIAAFIHEQILRYHQGASGDDWTPGGRARDSRHHNPYTGTYPEGVTPPGRRKHPTPDDGTGGPPLRL